MRPLSPRPWRFLPPLPCRRGERLTIHNSSLAARVAHRTRHSWSGMSAGSLTDSLGSNRSPSPIVTSQNSRSTSPKVMQAKAIQRQSKSSRRSHTPPIESEEDSPDMELPFNAAKIPLPKRVQQLTPDSPAAPSPPNRSYSFEPPPSDDDEPPPPRRKPKAAPARKPRQQLPPQGYASSEGEEDEGEEDRKFLMRQQVRAS